MFFYVVRKCSWRHKKMVFMFFFIEKSLKTFIRSTNFDLRNTFKFFYEKYLFLFPGASLGFKTAVNSFVMDLGQTTFFLFLWKGEGNKKHFHLFIPWQIDLRRTWTLWGGGLEKPMISPSPPGFLREALRVIAVPWKLYSSFSCKFVVQKTFLVFSTFVVFSEFRVKKNFFEKQVKFGDFPNFFLWGKMFFFVTKIFLGRNNGRTF